MNTELQVQIGMDVSIMVELDRIAWTFDEDNLLIKLHSHFGNDFFQISNQMNNIFFNQKFTDKLCQYRWTNYLDFRINRDEFSQKEELQIYNKLKAEELSDNFWFKIQYLFQSRPPAVLKMNTSKTVQKCLSYLCETLILNLQLRKRYQQRIKLFPIEVILVFFRLGKEKLNTMDIETESTIVQQCIQQCGIMIGKLEYALLVLHQRISQQAEQRSEKDMANQFAIMECLIFIDTIFRVYHRLLPYHKGDQSEQGKSESLLPQKKTFIHTASQVSGSFTEQKAAYYDEQVFIDLQAEEIKLLYKSDILQGFVKYFGNSENS